jgi:hypothetical protein
MLEFWNKSSFDLWLPSELAGRRAGDVAVEWLGDAG